MDKVIRAYHPGDAATMAAIANVATDYPWSKQVFRDCLSAEYPGWVLSLDGQVRGFSIIKLAGEEAELLNLCVDPVVQGMGFGRDLLQTALVHAAGQKVEHMFLEVRISNVTAIALYRQLGFNEVGVRKNYYPSENAREDAVIMFKML